MKKICVLPALITVCCVVFCAASLEAKSRHRYKEIEIEIGTGVYRTQTIQEAGKPPVTVKKEIMKKVKKIVDEHGKEVVPEPDDEIYTDTPAIDNPALQVKSGFNPFERIFDNLGAGVSGRYYYLLSEHYTIFSSTLVSSKWDKSLSFEGYGWDLYFSGGEFTQFHPGIKISFAYFSMDKTVNSFTEGASYARETAASTIVMIRADYYYHFTNMFFVYGGAGLCYQSLKTALDTNIAAYYYSGLEGNVWLGTVEIGTGFKLPITSGFNINLGGELIIFLRDRALSAPALTYGFIPNAGVSIVW
ncbi:MAG: hypothetical protein WCI43_03725 [Candidatus Firestonebacteria bacterium]